jgi:hypothetical protein
MQMVYNVVIPFSSLREQRLVIIGGQRRERSIAKELMSCLTQKLGQMNGLCSGGYGILGRCLQLMGTLVLSKSLDCFPLMHLRLILPLLFELMFERIGQLFLLSQEAV